MVDILISNLQEKIDVMQNLRDLITEAVSRALLLEDVSKNIEVSVALVDDDFIRELNRQYRSIDMATDVLSFTLGEIAFNTNNDFVSCETNLLGDVVVSLERAMVQADKYGNTFEKEVVFLVVHGILHLLGYDHESDEEKAVMRQKEKEIMKTLDLTEGIK